MGEQNEQGEQSFSFNDEGLKTNIPTTVPLLPVRDIVIFPFMIIPLFVGRESSIDAVNEALSKDRYIFLTAQKDPSNEEPKADDVFLTGTAAMIMRMLKLPDGRLKILVQGLARAKALEIEQTAASFRVNIQIL